MTRFAEEILKRRFEQNAGSEYVFAYDLSKSGHIPKVASTTLSSLPRKAAS